MASQYRWLIDLFDLNALDQIAKGCHHAHSLPHPTTPQEFKEQEALNALESACRHFIRIAKETDQ